MNDTTHEEPPRKSAAIPIKKIDNYVFCWTMMDISKLQDQDKSRCKLLGCQGLNPHTETFTVKPPHPVRRYNGE